MQTVRASLRVPALGLAILLCLTLAFVALTSKDGVPRIFFAVFCLILTGSLLAEYREESVLAHDHLVVNATVTEVRRSRRGARTIKYQFLTFDGKQYRGESGWSWRRVQIGGDVAVVYKAGYPDVNRPLSSFLFYRFRP